MGFLPTRWNKRLVSIATLAIAVLFAFGGLGGFASSIISGGVGAGLVGWRRLRDGYRTSAWGPTAAH
jgi:small-conductance mechanosensitive channel